MAERPSFEALERYVDEGCVDESMRRRIEGDAELESLVEQMKRNNALLRELRHFELDGGDEGEGSADPLVGRTIGNYRIKRAIASGGMGTVYEAVQERPRRTVALKVMRAGITSRSALRRFEYEAQLLARLRHPGIAQVFEAGTHDDGRARVPYFAMEYIPSARTLTEYAERKGLGVRERMELFARVCDAVQQGHQKGIIHRDLKPANILVDSSGQPKIIDFGVARATDSDLAVTTMQTDVGQLIGTLQYMSPEQCEADPHDLDVRSDVYSLGVVLYELLSGRTPYRVDRATVIESARVICENAPERLGSVSPGLRGDVETIVHKALEKDRDRRYQTASEFAEDVRRYLRNEPIRARPPTTAYRVRCFVRKHRPLVVATVVAFAALVAALVLTTLALRREQAQSELTEQEARQQRLVAEMYRDMFRYAGAGDREVTVAEVRDRWLSTIDERYDSPAMEALARSEAGKLLLDAQRYGEARSQFERALALRKQALGDEHKDTATSLSDLAAVESRTGNLERALELYERALPVHERLRPPDSVIVADQHNNIGTVYAAMYRNDPAREALHREAVEHLRAALEVYERAGDAESIIQAKNNLGAVMAMNPARVSDAVAYLREVRDARVSLYGREHPKTALSMNNLGRALERAGDLEGAARHLREALDVRIALDGEESPSVAQSRMKLGMVLVKIGGDALAEGIELLERSWEVLARPGATMRDLRQAAQAAGALADAYEASDPDRASLWEARRQEAHKRLDDGDG